MYKVKKNSSYKPRLELVIPNTSIIEVKSHIVLVKDRCEKILEQGAQVEIISATTEEGQ